MKCQRFFIGMRSGPDIQSIMERKGVKSCMYFPIDNSKTKDCFVTFSHVVFPVDATCHKCFKGQTRKAYLPLYKVLVEACL